jgi:hypothetical protein
VVPNLGTSTPGGTPETFGGSQEDNDLYINSPAL